MLIWPLVSVCGVIAGQEPSIGAVSAVSWEASFHPAAVLRGLAIYTFSILKPTPESGSVVWPSSPLYLLMVSETSCSRSTVVEVGLVTDGLFCANATEGASEPERAMALAANSAAHRNLEVLMFSSVFGKRVHGVDL